MRDEQHWPTTKATLLQRLRDHQDAAAWRRFIDLYLPLIYQYSRRRGLQDADAQNVAQEVLSQICRAIRSFEYDPERGRFRSWLGLITHQRLMRHLGGEWSSLRGIGEGAGDALCDEVPREVEGEWLEAINAHLYSVARERVRQEVDAETWTAFEQVWENGQSSRDVAMQLSRQTTWVYQAKFKVLNRIKDEVERLSDDHLVFSRHVRINNI